MGILSLYFLHRKLLCLCMVGQVLEEPNVEYLEKRDYHYLFYSTLKITSEKNDFANLKMSDNIWTTT